MPYNGFAHNLRGPSKGFFENVHFVARQHEGLSRFLRDRPGRSLSTRQTPRLVQGLVIRRADSHNRRMSQVEIRGIEEADIDETVRMWRRSREGVQSELEARLGYSPKDDLRFFTTILMKECEVWISVRGDRPTGLLAINGDSIEQLYVDPVEQQRGIGTTLLDFAKGRTRARLQLHTHQANMRARTFYEKRGFTPVEFGVSPPPENEPDVRYEWNGASSEHAV